MKARIIIIDIGTHKAQELRAIMDRSIRQRTYMLLRLLRSYRWSLGRALLDWKGIISAQDRLAQHRFGVLMVEPVNYGETMHFIRSIDSFAYVCGVASTRIPGPTKLHLSSDNLGHSIIPTKPNLTGKSHQTWNFNFSSTLTWFLENLCASSDDLIILRMNAEGVEKEIIDGLALRRADHPRVNGLFGSLGDVRKCFGPEAEKIAIKVLGDLGMPYVYFTSSPRSWRPALEELARMAS